jgi:hypothetical protein
MRVSAGASDAIKPWTHALTVLGPHQPNDQADGRLDTHYQREQVGMEEQKAS